MRYSILTLAACAPLAACNPAPSAPADTAAAVAAVKAVEGGMLAAFKAHDAAKPASFYTADAEIMVPFEAVVRGGDVAKSTAEDFKDPAFSIDFTNTRTEVAAGGDMAFTHGTFHVTYPNPAPKKPDTMDGRYVTVFRKQADGSWKAVQDISTPGAPATPPQDAPAASNG
jgi:ketosteroid isomerase-like protein